MPDISMCNGKGCPMKNTCYRYRAIPNSFRQSYFMGTPNEGDTCEYFWSIKDYKQEQLNNLDNVEEKEKKD